MTIEKLRELMDGWAPETEVLLLVDDQALDVKCAIYSLSFHIDKYPEAPRPALLLFPAGKP